MPSISSSIRKTYFREDHFKGGRSAAVLEIEDSRSDFVRDLFLGGLLPIAARLDRGEIVELLQRKVAALPSSIDKIRIVYDNWKLLHFFFDEEQLLDEARKLPDESDQVRAVLMLSSFSDQNQRKRLLQECDQLVGEFAASKRWSLWLELADFGQVESRDYYIGKSFEDAQFLSGQERVGAMWRLFNLVPTAAARLAIVDLLFHTTEQRSSLLSHVANSVSAFSKLEDGALLLPMVEVADEVSEAWP